MGMTYGDLIRLYFERSTALQWYWTIYIVVIGGLLAFSSLRQSVDRPRVILVAILYCCFAYKNLGAIAEVSEQRAAVLQVIKKSEKGPTPTLEQQLLEPTMPAPGYEGIRNFHIGCDILTIAALVAMERRRRLNRNAQAAGR